jgi:hypothetical protein
MDDLYSKFYSQIGKRADIINGELTLSDSGFLEITEFPKLGSIYVDNFNKTVKVIPLKNDFRGYAWDLYENNCAMCCARWHDNFFSTQLAKAFRGLSHEERKQVIQTGYKDLIPQFGFKVTETPQLGCIFIYEEYNHLAILVDTDTILHHPARKFSGLDKLNSEKILRILCLSKT